MHMGHEATSEWLRLEILYGESELADRITYGGPSCRWGLRSLIIVSLIRMDQGLSDVLSPDQLTI